MACAERTENRKWRFTRCNALVSPFGHTVIVGVVVFARRRAADADAIGYIVTCPWCVAVNELLIRPTEQE